MEDVLPIDQMPYLKERLGKARVDRLRYAQRASSRRQPGATNVKNTVIGPMQSVWPHEPGCPVADILTGISRSTDKRIPLSVDRLYNIFQCMGVINTREVKAMMDLDDRMAQRYVRAAKTALPFLEKHLID